MSTTVPLDRRGFLLGVASTGAVAALPFVPARLPESWTAAPVLRGDATFKVVGGAPELLLAPPPPDVVRIEPPKIVLRMVAHHLDPTFSPGQVLPGLSEYAVDVSGQHFTQDLVDRALRGDEFDACFSFPAHGVRRHVAARVQVTRMEAEALNWGSVT